MLLGFTWVKTHSTRQTWLKAWSDPKQRYKIVEEILARWDVDFQQIRNAPKPREKGGLFILSKCSKMASVLSTWKCKP